MEFFSIFFFWKISQIVRISSKLRSKHQKVFVLWTGQFRKAIDLCDEVPTSSHDFRLSLGLRLLLSRHVSVLSWDLLEKPGPGLCCWLGVNFHTARKLKISICLISSLITSKVTCFQTFKVFPSKFSEEISWKKVVFTLITRQKQQLLLLFCLKQVKRLKTSYFFWRRVLF